MNQPTRRRGNRAADHVFEQFLVDVERSGNRGARLNLDRDNHPFRGVEILQGLGYPEWVTRAILSHADYSGVPRETPLEKTLFACDELSGFVTAAALVRPSKSILDLEASSVMKRMKDKAFARAVPREDLRKGAEELGLPLETHVANVIGYMRAHADTLGLRGSL